MDICVLNQQSKRETPGASFFLKIAVFFSFGGRRGELKSSQKSICPGKIYETEKHTYREPWFTFSQHTFLCTDLIKKKVKPFGFDCILDSMMFVSYFGESFREICIHHDSIIFIANSFVDLLTHTKLTEMS